MNQQQASQLEHLLTDMCSLHEELAAVGQRKQNAMASLDVPAISQCTEEEYRIVNQLRQLQGRKKQWIDGWAERDATKPQGLAEAIDAAPEESRGRLSRLYEQLLEWMTRVKQSNLVALVTGRHCLDHFRSMIQILTQGGQAAPVYSPTGIVDRPAGARLVDDVA